VQVVHVGEWNLTAAAPFHTLVGMRECFLLIASIVIGNPAWADATAPSKDRWFGPNVGTAKFFTANPGKGQLLQKIGFELAELSKITEQQAIAPMPAETKLLTAALASQLTGEPQTLFPPDTPTLYLRWQGETLNPGDTIRCLWIAEDVGDAAPANYQVNEASTKASETRGFGTFTLSRPNKGWPTGKYRVEIYVGEKLAETIRFTIEKAGQ
jgi:hypothetical protein